MADSAMLSQFRDLIASVFIDPIEAVSAPLVDEDGTIRGKFQADNQVYRIQVTPNNQIMYVEDDAEEASFAESTPEDLDAADVLEQRSTRDTGDEFSRVFQPVATAIEQSTTFEELQDKVARVYPDLSSERLTDLLAQQMFLSDLAGRYEVLEETRNDSD